MCSNRASRKEELPLPIPSNTSLWPPAPILAICLAWRSVHLSFIFTAAAKQILLTNLMTDFPEMNIASDNVDAEAIAQPRRWNIRFIQRFMLTFGILSSVFDYLTFGALLLILHASQTQFRTAWFVESVVSASLIVLVIRSRKSMLHSRPGKYLLTATLLVVAATFILPYTPLDQLLGFSKIACLVCANNYRHRDYLIVAAEFTKRCFTDWSGRLSAAV